ncbi:MAG: protein-glutamate O-methyltransferase CheR [Verrucomicrobiae bacterium]|nr:protein-glutamate O-methyltransferase CheR [Verrucomicrobiae bacterium]
MSAIGEQQYRFICDLVYQHSRINLGPDKKELVAARVAKRLRQLHIDSYEQYCHYLKGPEGEEELINLVNVISTNFTNFFREIKHFEFLTETILPQMCSPNSQAREKAFRVWSAASSSGEEPYTISIVLHHFFLSRSNWRWQVDASDISTRMLDKARQGVYEAERINTVPNPEWVPRYFQRGTGNWTGYVRVKNELRNQVQFHHLNLLQPQYPFAYMFQVIFCRNVMIYFDRPTQEQLINKLTNQLVPGGYLLVGHSESLTGVKHHLHPVKPSIYIKPA